MRNFILKLIRLYHATKPARSLFTKIFFESEGSCRFYPTCSDYTAQAIKKYGVARGLFMGVWRVLRCHPFNKGGLDPVR